MPELNLFYSYGACNASAKAWTQLNQDGRPGGPDQASWTDMRGQVVKIVTFGAKWSYPGHFKANISCCAARNVDCSSTGVPEDCVLQAHSIEKLHEAGDSVPWQGYQIDYIEDMVTLMGAQTEYHTISRAALALFPKDWTTAAVQDVRWGLSDMSTGAPVTSERLSLTSFSREFEITHFHLFVPKPTAGASFLQVLQVHLHIT